MTQIRKVRINTLGNTPKKSTYRHVTEGYDRFDDFYMSDNIEHWMTSRARRGKNTNKPLF
jgi:hypothetical protein